MRRLSARQRSVVYFAYWHDLHPRAIVDLLATSPRTVHRELAQARKHLEVLLR